MTQQKLIALGGALRAGKDAVAGHLADKHGYVVMGMSDPLNEALQRIGPQGPWVRLDFDVIPYRPWLNGLRRGKFHKGEFVRYTDLLAAVGYVEAKRHDDVRKYLQGLGTEVGREMIGQDVWVDMAVRTIKEHWAEGRDVVITAIRFPNEVKMVRRLGGHLTWVNRPQAVPVPEEGEKGADEAQSAILSHASENSVHPEDFDYVLENDSTLEHLFSETDRLLEELATIPAKLPVGSLTATNILPGRIQVVGNINMEERGDRVHIWPTYDR